MASSLENFRRNLRRERKKRHHEEGGWAQHDLAEKAGFHRNYIGMLERGERQPSLDTLDTLAHVLGIQPYELLLPPEHHTD